jgi:hypothetical protein
MFQLLYTAFFPYNGAYHIPIDEHGNRNSLQV